jgi:hypothetical protein
VPLALGTVVAAIAGLAIVALPVRGQVPQEVLDRVVADIAARTGLDVASETGYYRLTELRSEAVTWRDGRLGCAFVASTPEPGAVSGWWVVVQLGASTYDYRIAEDGIMVLCRAPDGEADGG